MPDPCLILDGAVMTLDNLSITIVNAHTTTTIYDKGNSRTHKSAFCMESGLISRTRPARHRLEGRQSSPSLHHRQTPNRRNPQAYSSPLPQTQWSDEPSPYSGYDFVEPEQLPRQRHRSHGTSSERSQQIALSRSGDVQGIEPDTQRRRRNLREFFSREKPLAPRPQVDASLLYPELSPYLDTGRLSSYSTYSAPDELERHHVRSTSHTSDLGNLLPPRSDFPQQSISVPRSPTYPPAGRGRMNSATGVGDEAFEDEAQFRLFVEATAGLGPEQVFRHPNDSLSPLSPLSSSPRRTQSERILSHQSPARDLVSPLSDTPTTRFALSQLAQMPEASLQPVREPLAPSHSGLDLWLQPSSLETEDTGISSMEEIEADFDDELPDYAESQAQAQRHQRAEAARRAQELQRRWQLSGARRGI